MKTIITDQLNAVLEAANISTTPNEFKNIEAVVERCKDKSLTASAAADLICRDMDIDTVATYSQIKNELIAKGIFKN